VERGVPRVESRRTKGNNDARPSRRAAAGFTLLELVIVMAIMGIVFSFALPALAKGLQQWRLQAAVQEVTTLFKFTRNQAIARRTPLQVMMDRARGVYWLDNADTPMLVDLDQADAKKIRLFALPSGLRFGQVAVGAIRLDEERVGIPFYPKGNSTGGEVEILDGAGRRHAIQVDPWTGHARIYR
jgi:general secretion pathway protein H